MDDILCSIFEEVMVSFDEWIADVHKQILFHSWESLSKNGSEGFINYGPGANRTGKHTEGQTGQPVPMDTVQHVARQAAYAMGPAIHIVGKIMVIAKISMKFRTIFPILLIIILQNNQKQYTMCMKNLRYRTLTFS